MSYTGNYTFANKRHIVSVVSSDNSNGFENLISGTYENSFNVDPAHPFVMVIEDAGVDSLLQFIIEDAIYQTIIAASTVALEYTFTLTSAGTAPNESSITITITESLIEEVNPNPETGFSFDIPNKTSELVTYCVEVLQQESNAELQSLLDAFNNEQQPLKKVRAEFALVAGLQQILMNRGGIPAEQIEEDHNADGDKPPVNPRLIRPKPFRVGVAIEPEPTERELEDEEVCEVMYLIPYIEPKDKCWQAAQIECRYWPCSGDGTCELPENNEGVITEARVIYPFPPRGKKGAPRIPHEQFMMYFGNSYINAKLCIQFRIIKKNFCVDPVDVHVGEWSDAECFTVENEFNGDAPWLGQ